MSEIAVIIIVLALAVLTFLGLRTPLHRRMGLERAAQRITKLGQTSADRYGGIAVPGSPVAKGLDAIVEADEHFDVRHFATGAKSACETVVTAYADGDQRTLTNLLASEVYEGFEAMIRKRKDHGETAETRFLSIDATDIMAAELRGKTAYITPRFVSQLVSATRDCYGKVVDGDAINATTCPTSGFSPEMYGLGISTRRLSPPKPAGDRHA
jgi:predicted lipid-binding transport protein (Tim44 family)